MFANPQTLVLSMVLHDTLNGPGATDELRAATLRAAVHAWMEGHIEGEGRAGTPSLPTAMAEQDMPSPPFPRPDNERLRAILREAYERFAGGEPIAAALFASGLAYQAGLADGSDCPGCVPRAGSEGPEPAARIRAGQLTLTLSAGVPSLVDPSSPDKMH
jgi:hypothetical protein